MNLDNYQGIREWADERRAKRILQFLNGELTAREYNIQMGRIDVFERARMKRLDVTA